VLLYLAGYATFKYSPIAPDALHQLQAPSAAHLFGTDNSGFDVFSRVFLAARLDLPVAISATLIAALIGVPIGLVASAENRLTNLLMRLVDALQALPLLIVAIATVTLAGNSQFNVVGAIVLVSTPGFIRLTRSAAIVVRHSRFIEAAQAYGASAARVLFNHILPNILGIVLTQFTLAVGVSIVLIAGLSFLGLGTPPPFPSWDKW